MTDLQDALKARRETRGETQGKSLKTLEDPTVGLDRRLQERRRLRESGIQAPSPQEIDIGARRETLGAQVGQETLAEPGFKDLGARADIALSTTFNEKRQKFIDKFPDGDFVSATAPSGEKTILFRKNQNEPFAEFDAQMLERFELMGDVADLAGDVPSTAIELLVTRGGRLVTQMLQIFAGNIAGEAVKETVEELRGFQEENFGEILERSVLKGAIAAGGGAATVVFSGPLNAFRGAATLKVAPGARLAQRAATELGLPRLLPNQVAQSPLVRSLGGQSGALISTIGEYVRGQNEAAVRTILQLRERGLSQVLKGELGKLHTEAADQIVTAAKVVGTDLAEGGTAIQLGIAEYDNLANFAVNQSYENARKIAAPDFNLVGQRDIATEVLARAETLGPEGQAVARLAKEIADLETLGVERIELPSGKIVEFDPTDRLRWLRTQAFGLKTPNPGDIARAPQKLAGKLFGALNKTLDNPKNADPAFIPAWQKAAAEAKRRFDTMDKLAVVQASRSETPTILASRLAQPLQVDNLKVLKDTIPEDKFRIFQDSVKADFISPRNIEGLTNRLDSFDKPTLNVLLGKEDQAALRQIGNEFDRLKALDIEGVLQRQNNAAATVADLVENGQTARIADLVSRAGTDPTTSLRRSIRAGMIDNIWRKVVRTRENELFVNDKALTAELKSLQESGAVRLLTENDLKVLRNLERVVSFIPAAADAGTSLQRASAAAGFRELSLEAFGTILENIGVGRLMTSRLGNRILVGTGVDPLPFKRLRVLGAVLADTNSDLEKER